MVAALAQTLEWVVLVDDEVFRYLHDCWNEPFLRAKLEFGAVKKRHEVTSMAAVI